VKKHLVTFLDFYLKSSIHVALAVVSLAYISFGINGVKPSIELLIFIFCSAVFAYNFVKYFPFKTSKKQITLSPFILGVSVLALALCGYFVFYLKPLSILLVLLGCALVLLYSIPLHHDKKNFRNKKGWKIYLVVFSWLILTVALPFIEIFTFNFTLFFYCLLVQGIYLFVAILPFDIRDLNEDSMSLQTFPQKWGIKKVKIVGVFLLFVISLFVLFTFQTSTSFVISALLSFVLLAIFLIRSTPHRSMYYTAFWVEGIPMIWLGSFHLFDYF
jgi:hypothetical protein